MMSARSATVATVAALVYFQGTHGALGAKVSRCHAGSEDITRQVQRLGKRNVGDLFEDFSQMMGFTGFFDGFRQPREMTLPQDPNTNKDA
ncbi:unnamed protein product, partial [Ascophyllum nodosum]